MRNFLQKCYYWGPAIIWMVIIFSLSSRPSVQVSSTYSINFLFFKSLHVIEYAILYFLLFRGFYSLKNPELTLRQKLLYPIILSILYGISDEVHQLFVPTRGPHIRDVFIDTIGILLMFQYTKHNLHLLKKFL